MVVGDRLADEQEVEGDTGLFHGLTKRGLLGRLVAVARATRDAPGVAVMAPCRAVLQQHVCRAHGRVVVADEQTGGAVPAPVAMSLVAPHPAVAVADHVVTTLP